MNIEICDVRFVLFAMYYYYKILLRLDYMPLHYISLNLFAKCLYFQSIFILYYGSPKIRNCVLTRKTEIIILALRNSYETISFEITNDRNYMKIMCTKYFQHGQFSFVLCLKVQLVAI